jgi:hypothetical protein
VVRRGSFARRLVVEMREDKDQGAFFHVTAAGHPAVTQVQLEYPDHEENYRAAAGEIRDFSRLRRATFRSEVDAGTQLKVWAHKVTPEEDSEGIVGVLRVHHDGETRQFDLKLSKGQVVLPVAPAELDITLAETDEARPPDRLL